MFVFKYVCLCVCMTEREFSVCICVEWVHMSVFLCVYLYVCLDLCRVGVCVFGVCVYICVERRHVCKLVFVQCVRVFV